MSLKAPTPAENVSGHPIASPDEWLAARKTLLTKEKEFTHLHEELCAARRALPWVKIEKNYIFEGEAGRQTLADLFEGRSQLFVQHFMLGPGWDEGCKGCSFIADHVDSARQHFEHADLSFVAVSRAPWNEIAPFKKRMGWKFNWVSSQDSDFNFDFHVSFTPEEIARGKAYFNYEVRENEMDELPGQSLFYKNESGQIFHTYSSFSRGGEQLLGAFAFLDLSPKGRNETSTMNWVRLHDRYGDDGDACCA